jgi:L-iditol 2-dehydrogenase
MGESKLTEIPQTMRAAVLTPDRKIHVEERAVPHPASDEVLIAVSAVGVCGSDVHYYREGHISDYVVSAPLILGHEVAGTIVAVGNDVSPARVGQRVSVEPQHPCRVCDQCKAGRYNLCSQMTFYATPPIDGAFCGYVTIQDDFAHSVPESMTDEATALLEPLSVAVTACRKARITRASRILISGAGPIGLLIVQTARAYGATEIVVSDLVPERRANALRLGATRAVDPVAEDIVDEGPRFDAYIDASGAASAVQAGIKCVRGAGTVVLVGMGADSFELPVSTIQFRELTVTGVFRYTDTWPAAIALASSGAVDLDALVTGHYDLATVEQALQADTHPDSLKSIVYPTR